MNPEQAAADSVLSNTWGTSAVCTREPGDPYLAGMRDMVAKLRYVVLARHPKPTVAQLETLRQFHQFRRSDLMQVRLAIQNSEIQLGPVPVELAERVVLPSLTEEGFRVRIRELTDNERAARLAALEPG